MKKRGNNQNSAIVGNADPARKATNPKTNPKKSNKTNHLKSKLLATYYGHPMKDMKMIAITGSHGQTEVAHFVHEIIKSAGQPVAIFAAPGNFKLSALYKFLSEAWKAGANYVVVTAPAEALANNVFAELPVHIAALTDFQPGDDFDGTSALFRHAPDYVILNRDALTYEQFMNFAGTSGTLLFGTDRTSHIQIVSSKLYKKGSEAMLNIGGTRFTAASFLTGEQAISYIACAAAIADALHISPEKITDGLAEYQPETIVD